MLQELQGNPTGTIVLVDFELRIKEMLDEGDKDVLVSTSTLLYKT